MDQDKLNERGKSTRINKGNAREYQRRSVESRINNKTLLDTLLRVSQMDVSVFNTKADAALKAKGFKKGERKAWMAAAIKLMGACVGGDVKALRTFSELLKTLGGTQLDITSNGGAILPNLQVEIIDKTEDIDVPEDE